MFDPILHVSNNIAHPHPFSFLKSSPSDRSCRLAAWVYLTSLLEYGGQYSWFEDQWTFGLNAHFYSAQGPLFKTRPFEVLTAQNTVLTLCVCFPASPSLCPTFICREKKHGNASFCLGVGAPGSNAPLPYHSLHFIWLFVLRHSYWNAISQCNC